MNQISDITVVKLGGALLEDASLRRDALSAIASLARSGASLVIVHGGGKHIDRALGRLGIPKRTQGGLRVTDGRTLEVVVQVLAGLVNKQLVAELGEAGIPAVGLSGVDGGILSAAIHPPVDGIDLGFVGRVTESNPSVILSLVDHFLPVIASIAAGPEGMLLNVNADAAAAAVASSLKARRLVFLTDVAGLLDGNGEVVPILGAVEAQAWLSSPLVTGGMRPKLEASVEALAGGVGNVIIAGPATHGSVFLEGKGGTHLVAA